MVIALNNQPVSAQPFFLSTFFDDDNPSKITFSAPDAIKELLSDHFDLPDAPLIGKTAQHLFIRRAKQEISELLATEGYFTPTVTLKRGSSEDIETLEIVIEPGPRTQVSEVTIEFQGELAVDKKAQRIRIKQLRNTWSLKPGEPFRSQDWEEAKAQLLSNVRHKDYASAEIVDSQAIVDRDSMSVQLTVVIDSGPTFYLGI